jgi:hypothetical protein
MSCRGFECCQAHVHLRQLFCEARPLSDVSGPHQELLLHPRGGVHADSAQFEDSHPAQPLPKLDRQLERSPYRLSRFPAVTSEILVLFILI